MTTSILPSSDKNYLDDKLVSSNKIAAKKVPSGPFTYCIPPGVKLLGRKPTLDTVTITQTGQSSPDTAQYLQTILDPASDIRIGDVLSTYVPKDSSGKPVADAKSMPYIPSNKDLDAEYKCPQVQDSDALPLFMGDLAYITAEDAGNADYRGGFDFGVLAVPFKVEMTGKQAFASSATLGGYVGYRIPWTDTGLVFSPVIFAGASNISVPTAPGSSSTTETVAGLSYGAGLITTVKDSFQLGIVVGFDHVDSPTYAYNDKPWLSLEIGYSFAQ